MRAFNLNHLPVVDGVKYKGIVTENDLKRLKTKKDACSMFGISECLHFETQYIYDALGFTVKV